MTTTATTTTRAATSVRTKITSKLTAEFFYTSVINTLAVNALVIVFVGLYSSLALSEVKILGANNEKVDLRYTQTEGFFTVQEKYRVYSARVEIQDSSLKDIKEARIEGGEVVSAADGKIVFNFGAYAGSLEIETNQGKTQKYLLTWTPNRKGILREKCSAQSAKIVLAEKKQINFPIGQSCDVQPGGRLFVTISTPEEVKLVDSSAIEIAGKGERWRYFEVPASGVMGGVVAKYNYSYNDEAYSFNLVAPKEMTAAAKEEKKKTMEIVGSRFQNTFGLGTMALSYEAGFKGQSSPLAIRYGGLSTPFFEDFRAGGTIKMAMSNGAEDAITFTDGKGTLGYYKKMDEDLIWGLFGEFMYVNFSQSSTSLQLQATQMGVGASIEYFVNKNNRMSANLNMASFGSDVLTSHMEAGFEYKYKMGDEKAPWWIGFSYEIQSFGAINTSGTARTFNENAMSLLVSF